MRDVLASYQNGNIKTVLLKDGTKIHFMPDDKPVEPEFAESMDITITYKCDGLCPYCYQDAKNAVHTDLHQYEGLLRSIHPGTEAAIGGNDLTHPDLWWMLELLKDEGVVANITVNERHFLMHKDLLKEWTDKDLIHGLGVSLYPGYASHEEMIEALKEFPNAIVHTVAGIADAETYYALSGVKKVLILGYKKLGRGIEYYKNNSVEIDHNIKDIADHLDEITSVIPTICFDNLAIRQLDLKNLVSPQQWQSHYMGNDGTFSFYLNLAGGAYARSSLDPERKIDGATVDELFDRLTTPHD